MAKKYKRKPAKAATKALAPQSMDTESLADAATRALAESDFKHAIELYRELLKRERRRDWQEAQSNAYAGRASELAAKGMVKEALTVWRNRTEVCGTPLMSGPYPSWLMLVGETGEVLRFYRQRLARREQTDNDAELAALEAQLAPHLLRNGDALPAESTLMRYCAAARAALEAYANGSPELPERIKAIPFRSPYRDLGQILKATAQLPDDPDAAQTILQRVPADSPFAHLAAVARTATQPVGRGWLHAVHALVGSQRRLALQFKGIPSQWDAVLAEIARLGDFPAAGALHGALLTHRKSLPDHVIEPLCWQLSIHCATQARTDRQVFGRRSHFDETRQQALQAEQSGKFHEAIDAWMRAKTELICGEKHPDTQLRIALILRHVAQMLMQYESRGEKADPEALEWLAQSLTHDPDDAETVVALLAGYRKLGQLKEARAQIDAALLRFPDQAAVLLEAVEIALAGNAFKKAVGYARQILALDPINPRVRSLLGGAHLSHARKQIKAGKVDAALKELDEGEEWLRSVRDRGVIQLLRAIATHGAGRVDESRDWLTKAIPELGGAALGYIHLSLELAQLNQDIPRFAKSLDLTAPKAFSMDEVMALVRILDETKLNSGVLSKALGPLDKVLRDAAKLDFTAADALQICETLQRLEQKALVQKFAEAAQKRHPSPVFVFHSLNARYAERPWAIPLRDLDQLEQARESAARAGDQRTVLRIDHLFGPMPTPGFFFDDDEDDFAFGPPDLPFEGIPIPDDERAVLNKILEEQGETAFLACIKASMGKKLFRELEQEVGKADLIAALAAMLGLHIGGPPQVFKPREPAPKNPKTPPKSDRQRDLFDD